MIKAGGYTPESHHAKPRHVQSNELRLRHEHSGPEKDSFQFDIQQNQIALHKGFSSSASGNGIGWGVEPRSLAADRLQLLKLTPGALSNRRLSPRDAAPPNRPGCGAWTSR